MIIKVRRQVERPVRPAILAGMHQPFEGPALTVCIDELAILLLYREFRDHYAVVLGNDACSLSHSRDARRSIALANIRRVVSVQVDVLTSHLLLPLLEDQLIES